MRLLVLIVLVFAPLSSYSQKNNDSRKLLLKQVRYLKKHSREENSQNFQNAFQVILNNLTNSDKFYVNCNDYCENVNLVIKKMDNRLSSNLLQTLKFEASKGFFKLDSFLFSKINKDSINIMSTSWKFSTDLINKNLWLKNVDFEININKKEKVLEYYFEKLKNSKNLSDQNSIVKECHVMFPNINNGADNNLLKSIIGGISYNSKWPEGKVLLFDYSFINDYLKFKSNSAGNNQFGYLSSPPMELLRNWLKDNEPNVNLIDSVSYESINFSQGEFCDTLKSYKNKDEYVEIVIQNVQKKKFLKYKKEYNTFNLIQINYFDKGGLIRQRFFDYNVENSSKLIHYEYHFKSGVNVELTNLAESTIQCEKFLKDSCQFSEAKNKYEDLRKNNFPNYIEENLRLDTLIQITNSYYMSSNYILESIKESDLKLSKGEFNDALTLLSQAQEKYNVIKKQLTCIDFDFIDDKIKVVNLKIGIRNQQIETIKNKISIGWDLIVKKEFNKALSLFTEQRNNNLNDEEEVNIELDKLIQETNVFIEKEIEQNKINQIQKSILAGDNQIQLKKYDDALKIYQDARNNNFSSNLGQNEILDKKIKTTLELIENEKKRQLNLNFENSLSFTKIGKVEISKEYLKVDHFTNGDKLDFASTAEEFVEKTLAQIPVYCYYNFDSRFANKGYYYNLFALNDLDGRKLYEENYRLPFSSEIDYIKRKIDNQEATKKIKDKKELKDFIYKSNSDLNYNGFNLVEYERTSEKILTDELNCGSGGYIVNLSELRHNFWIYNDLDILDSEIKYNQKFLNTNFANINYSEIERAHLKYPIEYGIYGIKRKENYSNDPVYFIAVTQNVEDILPRYEHKGKFSLFASQIKLVKQRKSISTTDWLPNTTSTKLNKNYIFFDYVTSKNKVISEIKIAKNNDEWFNFINNKIPACASYEFKLNNDISNGKVYNNYVFNYDHKNNFPFVPNSKSLELIDLSNLRYSIRGSGEDFFNYLYNEHNLKTGGSTIEINNSLTWKNNNSTYIDEIERTSYIAFSKYSKYCGCENLFLGFFYKSENYDSGDNEINLELISFDYENNNDFPGYSVRFLKNYTSIDKNDEENSSSDDAREDDKKNLEGQAFGNGGFGGSGTGGFGSEILIEEIGDEDGATCSSTPTNLNTILNLLKNNVFVTKPTSAIVTISIRPDGSVSAVKISGLGVSEAEISPKIKSIIAKTKCPPCNGKNKNSRTYTFPKIEFKED
jgi:hypothetical protein